MLRGLPDASSTWSTSAVLCRWARREFLIANTRLNIDQCWPRRRS